MSSGASKERDKACEACSLVPRCSGYQMVRRYPGSACKPAELLDNDERPRPKEKHD